MDLVLFCCCSCKSAYQRGLTQLIVTFGGLTVSRIIVQLCILTDFFITSKVPFPSLKPVHYGDELFVSMMMLSSSPEYIVFLFLM